MACFAVTLGNFPLTVGISVKKGSRQRKAFCCGASAKLPHIPKSMCRIFHIVGGMVLHCEGLRLFIQLTIFMSLLVVRLFMLTDRN